MNQLKLDDLHITNFKGFDDYKVHANGSSLVIEGGNEQGKTSVFDAFTWLLFGKDSLNRTNFDIKPLDEEGNVLHPGTENEVEGRFYFNETPIKLKRVYAEKWTKKRNSYEKTMTGHETKYYIDDVKVKKREYEEKINQIIPENLFKILTNPLYFSEEMDAGKRREILLTVAGDITDEDITRKDPDLAEFIESLNGRPVADHEKIVREKIKQTQKNIDHNIIRMDETALQIDQMKQDADVETLQNQREKLDHRIQEKQEQIRGMSDGTEANKKRQELSDITLKITEIKNRFFTDNLEAVHKQKAAAQEKKSNIALTISQADQKKREIQYLSQDRDRQQKALTELRQTWRDIDAETFDHENHCLCPTCKQDLPEDQLTEIQEQFNRNKANRLEAIILEGKKKAAEVEKLEISIQSLANKMQEYESRAEADKQALEKLEKEIQATEAENDITADQDYQRLIQQKEQTEAAIQQIQVSTSQAAAPIREELDALEAERRKVQDQLNQAGNVAHYESRLNELRGEHKNLSREHERLSRDLYMIEQYATERMKVLEKRINEHFKITKFRLFKPQINAEVKEICTATVKGIGFDTGLNNANRINSGLDIINTLSRFYGISVPIFIDNSESVTDLIETDAQIIALYVKKMNGLKVYQIDNNLTEKAGGM